MNPPSDHNRQGPAANADLLGEEAQMDGVRQQDHPPKKPAPTQGDGPGAEGEPASGEGDPAPGPRHAGASQTEPGIARPGKDINQSGFIKSKDASKP